MDKPQLELLLVPKFARKHIGGTLDHFSEMVAKFQAGEWEPCIARAGKFTEAVLKALFVSVGQTPTKGRKFKVDPIIVHLEQLPHGSFDDTIRLTIPRACRFVYDIASNRGARHDPDEIDSNGMDASVVLQTCSWILAEMIRFAQKGSVDADTAKDYVESLSAKRYPLIEDVDGRVYFHYSKKSAPNIALLALAYYYPKRMAETDLIETIRRHQFTIGNAHVAVRRIKKFFDDDGHGRLRLLATGLKRAEEIRRQS